MAGVFAITTLGVLLHFTYGWSGGSRAVAVVAPVNESVWEHLKLVLVPVTLFGVAETALGVDPCRLWWAKLVEIVAACCFIVAVFYVYTGALGIESVVAVDIASYIAAIALGQWLSYQIVVAGRRVARLWVSAVAIAVLIVGFGIVTFAPPHVPLFREMSSGTYGPA